MLIDLQFVPSWAEQLISDPHGACWGASAKARGSASGLAHSRGWPFGVGRQLLSMSVSSQGEEDNFFIASWLNSLRARQKYIELSHPSLSSHIVSLLPGSVS